MPDSSDAAPPPDGSVKRLRVLVVEDHLDAGEMLAELIESYGHEAQHVPDGPSAIERAPALKPDVVLCDLGLPGMNGLEVARRLRALPELRGVMLVAVTGSAEEDAQKRSDAAGFDLHVTKPVHDEALRPLLERCAARIGRRPHG